MEWRGEGMEWSDGGRESEGGWYCLMGDGRLWVGGGGGGESGNRFVMCHI